MGQPVNGSTVCWRMLPNPQARANAAIKHAIHQWAPDMVLEDSGEVMLRMVTIAFWRWRECAAELAEKIEAAGSIEAAAVGKSYGEGGGQTGEYIRGLAAYEAAWGKQAMEWAAAAHKAGIDERKVMLAENQGEMAGQMLRTVLDAIDLTAEQRAMVPGLIREHLTLIIGGAA